MILAKVSTPGLILLWLIRWSTWSHSMPTSSSTSGSVWDKRADMETGTDWLDSRLDLSLPSHCFQPPFTENLQRQESRHGDRYRLTGLQTGLINAVPLLPSPLHWKPADNNCSTSTQITGVSLHPASLHWKPAETTITSITEKWQNQESLKTCRHKNWSTNTTVDSL